MQRRTAVIASLGLVLVAGLGLGACGDDDDPAMGAPVLGASTTTADAGGATDDPADADTTAATAAEVTCVAGTGGDADVAITGFTFDPSELDVDAGTAVTFTNQDPADHSVWSDQRVDGEPAFESVGSDPAFRLPEVLHEGDASTCTFPAAGTYAYLCGVHNSMRGTIVVA